MTATWRWLALTVLCWCEFAHAENYDLLIRNVRLLDGSGNPWYRADIGVKDDRIKAIGNLEDESAKTIIDGRDHYASPGFIDTHSHAAEAMASKDRSHAGALLVQGITTVLLNPDGGGPVDLEDQAKMILADGIGVNVGLLVPHGSVRSAVLGLENRPAGSDELVQMGELVRKGMQFGAYGLSSGTFYKPGSYAPPSELVYLARIVAGFGGVYASHIRDESNYTVGLKDAVAEVISVAEEADIPAVVTHIKALGPPVWGFSSDIVAMIEEARDKGLSIYTDQYPYIASSTSLTAALLPRWAEAGGRDSFLDRLQDTETRERIVAAMRENLERRGGADRIRFSLFEENPGVIGMSLEAVARQSEEEAVLSALNLLRLGDPKIISFNMQEDDVIQFMLPPWNMTASDGRYAKWGEGAVHPRAFGTFPRKIHKYVVEENIVTLEHAIRSMTSLPAQVYRIKDRGRLIEGAYADIVIFDLARMKDTATFDNPYQLAEGVRHVLVNGRVAYAEKGAIQETHGRLIRRN